MLKMNKNREGRAGRARLPVTVALILALILPTVACTGNPDAGTDTRKADTETAAPDTNAPTGDTEPVTEDTAEQTGETETESEQVLDDREITVKVGDVEAAFASLPVGTVRADSWLSYQMTLLCDNIASDFEKLSPDCRSKGKDCSGWLGGTGESWERGTYYVRGLVSLAYVTDNQKLKNQAQKWIDWCLESQTGTGAFGPYAATPGSIDYWPLMPMLMALEEYADATGDARVVPFLERYFAWEAESLKTRPLSDWGQARGGDNILAVYWLYRKNGDEKLLDLCRLLYTQTYDWASAYGDGAFGKSYHIVNLHESFKLFPLMYAVTGDQTYLDLYERGVENLFMTSGRADGMSNGDETTRGISTLFGTETCAVVERMLSDEIALTLLGDATLADRLELLAYNALPQQLLPDGNGQVYFTMQNQVSATLGAHGFTSDGGDRSVYGTPGGYPCCVHNYMMGWPLFVASMWMQTDDGGLAAGAYGPCHVTSGNLTLTETTDYPFEDTVRLTVSAPSPVRMPLYLRVPGWCDPSDVRVSVNGRPLADKPRSGAYFSLTAEWRDGDVIELTFTPRIRLEMNENNSVSVKRGALLYALTPGENLRKIDYNPNGWNLSAGRQYGSFEYTAAGDWNYALTGLSFDNPDACFTVSGQGMAQDTRFTAGSAPITLTCVGRAVPEWRMNREKATAGTLPISPLSSDALAPGDVTLTLIPYGFTRVRIAAIPWSGSDVPAYTAPVDGGHILFDNVIVPSETSGEPLAGKPVDGCALTLTTTLSERADFDLYVNRVLSGRVGIGAGTTDTALDIYGINPEYRNRIELIPVGTVPDITGARLSLTCGTPSAYRYEAEEGRPLGSAANRTTHIGGIDSVGDGVLFPSVRLGKSGTCTVRVYYAAASGDATHTLYIDDLKVGSVSYAATGSGWGVFDRQVYADLTLDLPAGEHVFKLVRTASDTGFAEIDAMDVILTDAHPVDAVPGESDLAARYETEKGRILGKCYATGTHVAGIDNEGDGVELDIEVPKDGAYILRVNHTAPMGNATHTVLIDGVEIGKIAYPGTSSGWGTFLDGNYGEIPVTLTAGPHTVTLIRRAGEQSFAEVDALSLLYAD